MDRKTLEYMEERAKKGREIVNTIKQLTKNIEDIVEIKSVYFVNKRWDKQFDSSTGDLTVQMKDAYIKAAKHEIELLEQELAEL